MTSCLLYGSEEADEKVHKAPLTDFPGGSCSRTSQDTAAPQFCHSSDTVDKAAQPAGLCP